MDNEPDPAPTAVGPIPAALIAGLSPAPTQTHTGEVTATACAQGCALLSPADELVVALPQYEGSLEPYPVAFQIVRMHGAEPQVQRLPLTYSRQAIAAFEDTEGAPAPWMGVLTRALGDLTGYRFAESISTERSEATFGVEGYYPLIALGGPLEGHLLYAEPSEAAYRIHLVRRDGSSSRLLASLPIQPTACDGDGTDSACAAPLSLGSSVASPDGHFLTILYRYGVAGGDVREGDAIVLTLSLDEALSITPARRREELLASMRAPGDVSRIWRNEDAMRSRGEQCDHGCGLFRPSGEMFFVRPGRVAHAEPMDTMVFRPDGETTEVEIEEGDDARTRAAAVERALAGAPRALGRRIVARQANAAWESVIHVPLVELRAPHLGAQLSMEAEGEEYVVRLRRGDAEVELGRIPALQVDGRVSPPTIVEVIVPPSQGSPITVLGAAPSRLPSAGDGIEHTYFHASFQVP